MKFNIHKNFFGIRTQVRLTDQILLGVVPILAILLFWVYVTTGTTEKMILPDGEFENWEQLAPPEGTWFKNSVRLTVANSSLTYGEDEIGRQVTWLEKDGERFLLNNIPARTFEKSVRLTLPPGRLVTRDQIEPEMVDLPTEKPAQTPNIASQSDQSIQGESTEVIEKPTMELPATSEDAHSLPPVSVEPAKPVAQPTTPVDSSLPVSQTSKPDQLITIAYKYEVVETRRFSPVILPSPSEVLRSLPSLVTERSLSLNMLYSFMRVGAGFLVAFIAAFPMALLMGTFSKFKSLFSPLMLFGGYLPIPALVPLTMILFGTTEKQKIMFLALGFTIYLLPLFVKALEEVDNVYLQTGYTLGAGKYDVLNRILLPIALPNMFDAMRIGFGVGWGFIILAEMVDMGSFGVGTLILTSQRRGPREDIYLVLIAIVVLAFITDKIWDKVDRELFPYRRQER